MAGKKYALDFRVPETLQELSPYLGVSEELIKAAINPHLAERLYQKHLLPKKGRRHGVEYRVVWEATPPLADAYKNFGRRFDLFLRDVDRSYPHVNAFGYIRGRSTIDNARPHCGAYSLLRTDIKNFFPSISVGRLRDAFLAKGLHEEVANILSKFLTIEDALPLGLHASPMLANMICIGLDQELTALAVQHSASYSRYADDITISSDQTLPNLTLVDDIVSRHGFELNRRKTRITKRGQAHFVTGLSVSDGSAPRIPRSMKRKIRQELYYCRRYGILRPVDFSFDLNRGVDETFTQRLSVIVSHGSV